jgi:hypothetical protein
MFDVFTEEIEVVVKDGIANLYWYKNDLKKAWLRSGVDAQTADSLSELRDTDGEKLSKRKLMDRLYERLRVIDFNKRLEISRNFVRILIEHKNFVPQDPNHRVEVAERCALKLREMIAQQEKEQERKEQIKRKIREAPQETYSSQLLKLRERFVEASQLDGQSRGYAFEKIFSDLMKVSGIPAEKPFRIEGEQIDGAIKYDGHYYLVELKWVKRKCNQPDIASLYLKAEGKMDSRGIFIAMEGYSSEVLSSLPKGKEIKVLLLDGIHFSSVIYENYTFQELIEHAISYASVRGEIYCPTII